MKVKETYRRYRLVNYFDVWGNPEDGWQVNNLCVETDGLEFPDDWDEKEILRYLKNTGWLTTDDTDVVRIDTTDDMLIEIYSAKDEMPLGRLEMMVA